MMMMINSSQWFFPYGFLLYSLIFFNLIESNNDSNHQIFQVDIGQDVTMSCLFDPLKLEQIAFMRQMTGDILSVGNELFVDLTHSKEHFQLKQISSNRLDFKIISIEENHSDLYTCMFNDQKLFSYLIQVFVPPRFIGYYPLEGSISSSQGSTLNLFCDVLANPPVNITWIFTNQTKFSQIIHSGKDLLLTSINISDGGLYQCIASNDHHTSISRSFFLTVQYPPQISIMNKKARYSFHDHVDIRCHVCSIPPVHSLYWYRNHQPVHDENIRIKSNRINEHCSQITLQITTLHEKHFGSYQCRAGNSLGEKSETIYLRQMIQYRKSKEKIVINESNRNGRTASSNQIFELKSLNQTVEKSYWNTSSKSSSGRSLVPLSFLVFLSLWKTI